MARPHKDGPPQRATVPLWVVAMPGAWTMVAAANKDQATWIADGWANRRGRPDGWYRVNVKRARAKDIERARSWAADGDPDAQAILRLVGLARDDEPPAPQPQVEDQLTLI